MIEVRNQKSDVRYQISLTALMSDIWFLISNFWFLTSDIWLLMSDFWYLTRSNTLSRFFRVAPFDVAVFVPTIVFILALGFFVVRVLLAYSAGTEPEVFDLGAGVVLAAIIGFARLRSVKGYRIGQGELLIERAGPGKVHIPLESILGAEAQSNMGAFIRSGFLSTQGLFGWSGMVSIRKPTDLKTMHAEVYGTNPANAVAVRLLSERTIIVTPADAEGFVGALREAGVTAQSAGSSRQDVKKWNQGAKKRRLR
jgi:Bacterial PH domain